MTFCSTRRHRVCFRARRDLCRRIAIVPLEKGMLKEAFTENTENERGTRDECHKQRLSLLFP
jgi:hypothetical protein